MSSSNATNAQAEAGSRDQRGSSTEYQAPYQRNKSPHKDHYIIAFYPGHTLAKHFAFLGRKFDVDGSLDEGYHAKLDRELFEAVRRDPGVELIEDNTLGEWGPSEEELIEAARSEAEKDGMKREWDPTWSLRLIIRNREYRPELG